MKQTVRSFALGLLTATIILGFFYWTDSDTKQTQSKPMSQSEMIHTLEESGYHIFDDDELRQISAENNESKESQKEKETTEIPPTSYAIDVVKGTTSKEISLKLEEAGVIEKAEEFDQYIKENQLSRYIQIGQVTLNSTMTFKEIAEAITSQ
ncbi:endolytic transglycosylase MltG [Halobacillus sp. BBL2006]|uniref:endolytic transglycosylase MltG n=1 Tax=Halobacillus sp. BBL2006 TaxID=1543706 RepID=UPI0005436627|nr:endolytic transglycosylase MltG [Halobacillus sp. BBL2006]KHE67283.1 hypothetical protein LD39_18330 [Halobacillus sp. BBL2006]